MKKILTILFLSIFCFCFADDWQEYWVKAVECCETKKYQEAEEYFLASIGLIEKQRSTEKYHVYVDKARLLLLTERYEEALIDISIALDQGKLSDYDMMRALATRMTILARIGKNPEQMLKDAKDLQKYNPNRPKEEISEEHIIIRNIPECSCYKTIMTNYFVKSGICEKEQDIQILKSNIMIVKKKKCPKGINCNCIGKSTLSNPTKQQNCEWYCDKAATAGHAFCGAKFKSIRCIVACSGAVDYLNDKCYWCCSDGDFYKNCIKPFEFILDYIKEPCDPYWD